MDFWNGVWRILIEDHCDGTCVLASAFELLVGTLNHSMLQLEQASLPLCLFKRKITDESNIVNRSSCSFTLPVLVT